MKNPLVENAIKELKQHGFQDMELIHESYSPEHFGNAVAIYRLGNVYLKFWRDRDDDMIAFYNPAEPKSGHIWDDIALVLGLVTLDELAAEYKPPDFSKPPSGPPPLSETLGLIKQHYAPLQHMFSPPEAEATFAKLEEASRERCKIYFG